MNSRVLVVLLLAIVIVDSSYAATIHGAVYNPYLRAVQNVQLEINTTPLQHTVSINGLYFFYVPPGNYEISVEKYYQGQKIYSTKKSINVDKDGEYNIDIVVEPLKGVTLPPEEQEPARDFMPYYFIGGSVLLAIVGAYVTFQIIKRRRFHTNREITTTIEKVETAKEKEDTPEIMPVIISPRHTIPDYTPKEETKEVAVQESIDDLDNLVKIIKEEGGRTTQKEIRKRIPLSEAKVSLMISELEAKGKVEKIKKGRGNIIVLKGVT